MTAEILKRLPGRDGKAVLFLDVDGVLNNESVFRDRRFGPCPIDHECVQRLQGVVLATGSQIVLSSAWRGGEDLERKLDASFVFVAWPKAVDGMWQERIQTRHVDGSTKRLDGKRGEEIAEWLSRHPEVERYAIVDDDSDMLPEQLPFFVKTTFETGMTDTHASRLIELLSAPTATSNESLQVGSLSLNEEER